MPKSMYDSGDAPSYGGAKKKAPKKKAPKKAPKKKVGGAKVKKTAPLKGNGSLARARETKSRTMNPSLGYA